VKRIHEVLQLVIDTNGLQIHSLGLLEYSLSRVMLIGKDSTSMLRGLILNSLHQSHSSPTSQFLVDATSSTQRLNNVWKQGKILSVDLNDPRATYPSTINTLITTPSTSASMRWPKNSAQSSLWSNAAATSVQHAHQPQVQLTNKCHKNHTTLWSVIQKQLQNVQSGQKIDFSAVVASSRVTTAAQHDCCTVPILLIRHRGSRVSCVHEQVLDGWSIILPSGWATDLLSMATKKGAVAIGVEELEHLQRKEGVLSFPRDFLDTTCGMDYWTSRQEAIEKLAKKRPTSKRQVSDFLSLLTLRESVLQSNREMTVIRNNSYLQAFLPPSSSCLLSKEHVINVRRTLEMLEQDSSLPAPVSDDVMEPLPVLPQATFVHMTIKPLSRSLPIAGCSIYAPTQKDVLGFVKQQVLHKERLQSGQNMQHGKSISQWPLSKCWRGGKVEELSGRKSTTARSIIGIVSSGYHRHCNRDNRGVIALCDVEMVHKTMKAHFELVGHPAAHKLVLFQNPNSRFLRPALIDYL
jgi:hypothetical protein